MGYDPEHLSEKASLRAMRRVPGIVTAVLGGVTIWRWFTSSNGKGLPTLQTKQVVRESLTRFRIKP